MTFPLADDITMSDEEYLLFRDCIYHYSGMYFGSDSRYLLEKRLSRRLTDVNIPSFREYYHYLKYSRDKDQEMMDIMDILTVNETYFFRESYQLKAFTDEIIPELIARTSNKNSRSLHIWSAGCSTGEEAYTIAMLLLEINELKGWKIDIIGTDISQRVLRQARHGVYSTSAFRATDDYYRKRYFHTHENGLRINDEVRECVTFSHLNLFDANRIVMLGRMDLIFCRNVIIYFDLDAKKKVVENFHKTLSDGGFLLLGHSESLMNISTQFTLRHFKNDMIYQKPDLTVHRERP
jgi:chemotaxis protein methyltransferase CheR